ncbi:MAG: hypothetical protein K9G64_06905 [Bacteroidia bacterium]|nr:hypothetical protein [Bacteroidia bacterium]
MNKIYTLILVLGFSALASCVRDPSKDDVIINNTTPYETTTVTLTDSLGLNEILRKEATASIIVNVKMSAGISLKEAKMERKIDLNAPELILFNNRMDTVSNFKAIDVFNDNISTPLTEGSIVTYTITVTDSKLIVATASIIYIVKRGNAVLISNDIELAGQLNTSLNKNFLGLVNNFESYSNGGTGNAGINSYYIDFVYYFDATDMNVMASPNNVIFENSFWYKEISTWSRQNDTKFKVTSIDAPQFDKIRNLSKIDDSFYNLDFLNGTTDKITNFSVNDVFAFKNVYGKVGLLKITQIAVNESGSIKVQIICQK